MKERIDTQKVNSIIQKFCADLRSIFIVISLVPILVSSIGSHLKSETLESVKAQKEKVEVKPINKACPVIIDNANVGKLSLAQCKNILNTDGVYYTDDEVIELRNWLYHMADIVFDTMDREEANRQTALNNTKEEIIKS